MVSTIPFIRMSSILLTSAPIESAPLLKVRALCAPGRRGLGGSSGFSPFSWTKALYAESLDPFLPGSLSVLYRAAFMSPATMWTWVSVRAMLLCRCWYSVGRLRWAPLPVGRYTPVIIRGADSGRCSSIWYMYPWVSGGCTGMCTLVPASKSLCMATRTPACPLILGRLVYPHLYP